MKTKKSKTLRIAMFLSLALAIGVAVGQPTALATSSTDNGCHLNAWETENTPDGFYYDPAGGTVYIIEALWPPEISPIITIAHYSPDGRFIATETIPVAEGNTWLYAGTSVYEGYTKKVMMVDSTTFAPLTNALTLKCQ